MRKREIKKALIHLILIAGIGVTILPFFWMITTAFKTQGESVQMPPIWFPSAWRLDAFKEVLAKPNFLMVYKNTIITTVVTVLGQVGLCAMAGYGFAPDIFDASVSDHSEHGTFKYHSSLISAEPIQRIWHLPFKAVVSVSAKRAGGGGNA